MNSRLKSFGFGKRKSSNSVVSQDPNATPSQTPPPTGGPVSGAPQIPQQLSIRPGSIASASSTSLSPMNHPGGPNRPPSYSANNFPPGAAPPVGRTSPLTNQGPARTPPSQMVGGPPPINTGAPVSGYPPTLPGVGGGPPPGMGGPPGYGGQQGGYGGPPQHGPPGGLGQPMIRPGASAAEVEGNSRSKAQLIVGIDFVSGSDPRSSSSHQQPRRLGNLVSKNNPLTSCAVNCRARLSRALHSHSRPTTKQRKTSSPNGQVRGRTTSKRCAANPTPDQLPPLS